MREAQVTMDLPAVPVLLDSRATVVSPVLVDPWEWLEPPDPLGQSELLADLETVESLAQAELLDLLGKLELEVHLDLLDLVVRREWLEKKETEA